MNYEEYNTIFHTFESLTPSQCILRMWEMTDAEGHLEIPAWPHDNDPADEDAYLSLQMAWTREDAEALAGEHAELAAALRELAERWKNDELGFTVEENRLLLSDELLTVWCTYVETLAPDDMDFMRFYDAAEKEEAGTASPEELRYFHAYMNRVREEAKRRLGGKIAQSDEIIRAQRLHKLMAQDAPQILIDNESRLLAQAMAVRKYGQKAERISYG